MKRLSIVIAGALTALALLAAGCSGGDSGPSSSGDGIVSDGAGMTVPNTFLMFEGKQYRLLDLLQADLISEGDFAQVGATSQADIDFSGELKVYRRAGDADAVYTFSPKTTDDVAFWLRWQDVLTETPSAAR